MSKNEKFTTDMTTTEAEVAYNDALGAVLEDGNNLNQAQALGSIATTLKNVRLIKELKTNDEN